MHFVVEVVKIYVSAWLMTVFYCRGISVTSENAYNYYQRNCRGCLPSSIYIFLTLVIGKQQIQHIPRFNISLFSPSLSLDLQSRLCGAEENQQEAVNVH